MDPAAASRLIQPFSPESAATWTGLLPTLPKKRLPVYLLLIEDPKQFAYERSSEILC